MRIKEKKKALIVKGVVVPCGLSDSTNDKPQSKEDIKKIFTNYISHDTDVQHSWVKNIGIYPLENTLCEHETTIAGQTVPANSWIASHLVINPDIQAMIRDEELKGYSLGAVNDKGLNENQFLNKSLRYEHLKDSEDLNPLFISFVDKPAHGFNWEVYDYDSFLAKSLENGDEIMSNEENQAHKGYVSEGFLERVLGNFLSKSETPEDEQKEEIDEELEKSECADDEKLEKAETVLSDEDINRLVDALVPAVAERVIDELKSLANEPKGEPKEGEESTLEKSESSEEKEDEDETKMEKSENPAEESEGNFLKKSTTKVNEPTKFVEKSTSTKRDRYGRNIKYL